MLESVSAGRAPIASNRRRILSGLAPLQKERCAKVANRQRRSRSVLFNRRLQRSSSSQSIKDLTTAVTVPPVALSTKAMDPPPKSPHGLLAESGRQCDKEQPLLPRFPLQFDVGHAS